MHWKQDSDQWISGDSFLWESETTFAFADEESKQRTLDSFRKQQSHSESY